MSKRHRKLDFSDRAVKCVFEKNENLSEYEMIAKVALIMNQKEEV